MQRRRAHRGGCTLPPQRQSLLLRGCVVPGAGAAAGGGRRAGPQPRGAEVGVEEVAARGGPLLGCGAALEGGGGAAGEEHEEEAADVEDAEGDDHHFEEADVFGHVGDLRGEGEDLAVMAVEDLAVGLEGEHDVAQDGLVEVVEEVVDALDLAAFHLLEGVLEEF